MKRIVVTLQNIGFVSLFLFFSSFTRSFSQPPANKHPNMLMPPGPFSTWPTDRREFAIAGVRTRCTFAVGMSFAGNKGPAKLPEFEGAISACVAGMMPDDWPGKPSEETKSKNYLAAAKRLDPTLPDPSSMEKELENNWRLSALKSNSAR